MPPWAWHVAAGLVPFLAYLRTLAPTVYGLDSAELTTGAWTLGIVHSPGCPLYLLLGRLFCMLPIGDVGYRMNLMSALFAAGAIVLLNAVLHRLTARRMIALATSWLLAFSYYFWTWAVVAELYALHLFIVGGLLLLVLRWKECPRAGRLWLIAFLFGLGMGNHMALLTLLPGFAWLVGRDASQPLRDPRVAVGALLSGLLGFVGIYLYLPLRHAAGPALDYVRDYFPNIHLDSWRGWLWMVGGQMFRRHFLQISPSDLIADAARLAHQLFSNFGLLGALTGMVGLVCGLRRDSESRDLTIALALMFAGHAGFILTYGVGDNIWMYSVVYLVWSVWIGLGLTAVATWLSNRGRADLVIVPQAAAVALALWLLLFNYTHVDLSRDDSARRLGERILHGVKPRAVLLGTWKDVPIIEYLQIVEHQRPDVRVLNLVFLGSEVGSYAAHYHLRQGISVYTTATNVFRGAQFEFQEKEKSACFEMHLGAGLEYQLKRCRPEPARGETQ